MGRIYLDNGKINPLYATPTPTQTPKSSSVTPSVSKQSTAPQGISLQGILEGLGRTIPRTFGAGGLTDISGLAQVPGEITRQATNTYGTGLPVESNPFFTQEQKQQAQTNLPQTVAKSGVKDILDAIGGYLGTFTGTKVAGGIKSLADITTSAPQISSLLQKREGLLSKAGSENINNISDTLLKQVPKELAGEGISMNTIQSKLKDYISSMEPFVENDKSGNRVIPYTKLQDIIVKGNQAFEGDAVLSRIKSAAAKVLTQEYTGQVETGPKNVADLNQRISHLLTLQKEFGHPPYILKRLATAPLVWGVYQLLNAAKKQFK